MKKILWSLLLSNPRKPQLRSLRYHHNTQNGTPRLSQSNDIHTKADLFLFCSLKPKKYVFLYRSVKEFFFSKASIPDMGSNQPPIPWLTYLLHGAQSFLRS